MNQWSCPKCKRLFKTENQSHSCTNKDMGELFLGKPDELVLAFDALLQTTTSWTPNSVGTATHSIVFTNKKAWLIVKPMKTCLDIKFYYDTQLESDRFHKVTNYFGKFAHHLRVSDANQMDNEFFELIRIGYEYAFN